MSLIKELESKITNSNSSLVDILMQMKILAAKLGNQNIISWIDLELNGYADKGSELPRHRKGGGLNFGNILGPFWTQMNNVQIPTNNFPQELKTYANELCFVESVGTLEEMAKSGKSYIHPWPIELAAMAAQYNLQNGYQYTNIWKPVEQPFIRHVLGCIRNKMLDLIIELEKTNPEIEKSDEEIKKISKETAASVFQNINLTLGNENKTELTIVNNDIESLVKYLEAKNIEKTDIDELRKAIKEDKGKKGNQILNWIGKLSDKVICKGADIAVIKLVTVAVNKFLGI